MEALRKVLSSNWGLACARKVAAQQQGDQSRSRDKDRTTKLAELKKAEGRIRNLVTQIADGVAADYVRDVVNSSIARASQLKKELAGLETDRRWSPSSCRLPTR